MNVCDYAGMQEHIISCGYKHTSNVFFVEDRMYWEFLTEKQSVIINYEGALPIHKLTQSSVYFSWNYISGVRSYVDYNTFQTQLKLFKFFKETHEDYMDNLVEELLNKDLSSIAIMSEHML